MFRTLDYQDRVLRALDDYLATLKDEKKNADAVAEILAKNPGLKIPLPDFPEAAWGKLKEAGKFPASRAAMPYSPRVDGCNRPVPNVVLKVPTGGGKTFLATQCLSRIFGQYLNRNTGFVLWIVPNEAIYSQTLRHLKDRQHVYRQVLDRAAAGRVRILEKTDRLDARDIEGQLCVMLLMLQSANRETNDTLRMFKDRGDVHGFVPPEGEQGKHKALKDKIPNLDVYEDLLQGFGLVKESLGNALRITRPVVVMDEGHKATSDLAFRTLYGFNPCFVVELTATPKDIQPKGGKTPTPGRYANVLVEVTGKELDDEGMIKMPLNVDARQGANWKQTLAAALERLNALDADARKLQAEKGRYIRPIMLVQVERTGKEQRESGHIHADDVRDWLKSAGLDEAEIATKTAETNDLNQPENLDLLSPANRVRAIITKSALQEGWDCPFAYVLCSLAAQSNLAAMTQLVGRILRQPHAMKTGIDALDECHVITHHRATGEVVKAIKDGLEADGLSDLVIRVEAKDAAPTGKTTKTVKRREEFAKTEIYLPKVLSVEGGIARELDYEGDILASIDWRGFDPTAIADAIPVQAKAAESQLQRISLTDDETHFMAEMVAASTEKVRFDASYAVRMIGDIVPNPFVAREIVGRVLERLDERGFNEAKIGGLAGTIIEHLWRGLENARDKMAEKLFRERVASGSVQFRLRLDGNNWRMPFAYEAEWPHEPHLLTGNDLQPVKKSLFDMMLANDFNGEERSVAVQLDGEAAITWWHRNVARTQFPIQGWRRHKIYPDFIFAVAQTNGASKIVALETKGDQLDNSDTAYKRSVLELVSKHFAWDDAAPAGTLELVRKNGETVECSLVLMADLPTELPKLTQ